MNSPTRRTFAAPLALFGLITLAGCVAGPDTTNTGRGAEVHFSELDGDDNRMITRDELDSDLTLSRDFDRYDVDGNGSIELDEFHAYIKDNR